MELELEGASNFRVVNIFGGVRVRDCKYFSKRKSIGIDWKLSSLIYRKKKKYMVRKFKLFNNLNFQKIKFWSV